MPDPSELFCAHCGGGIDPKATSHDGQGTDGTVHWCSEICRQVVIDGLTPTRVGPATDAEILQWLAAEARNPAPTGADVEALKARMLAVLQGGEG